METEVFHQQVKKNHAKPEEFRPAKPEPVVEPVEDAVPKITEELPMVEASKQEIPFSVSLLCANRINAIDEVIAELEREKSELQAFLRATNRTI